MRSRDTLQNQNFNGLSALITVRKGWMENYDSLENPIFDELSALITVGKQWMENCISLSEDIKQIRDDFLRDHTAKFMKMGHLILDTVLYLNIYLQIINLAQP